MKYTNTFLNKVMNKRELEYETFDLLDVMAKDYDEQASEYRTHAVELEMDVSNGLIPFPKLNKAEEHTWETYCPNKTDLKEYKEMLPLVCVRLANEVVKRGWFYKIQVWSENKEEINPIMVGVLSDRYDSPLYLLARWGLSLKSYEDVRDSAKKIWTEQRLLKQKEVIAKAEKNIQNIDLDCAQYFKGEYIWD